MFTNRVWVKDHANKSRGVDEVIPVHKIAEDLDVTFQDILICFRKWGENGYPQEYFYKTGTGTKSDGGPYDVGLRVWNYQGEGDPGVYPWGHLDRARSWGSSYRGIDNYKRFYYTLGVVA